MTKWLRALLIAGLLCFASSSLAEVTGAGRLSCEVPFNKNARVNDNLTLGEVRQAMNRRVYQAFDLRNVSGRDAISALSNTKLVPNSETAGLSFFLPDPANRLLQSGRVTLRGRNVSFAVALNSICEQTDCSGK